MEIKDLQPRQGKVDITIEVTEKGDVREFEKFGKKGRVCSAKAKDDSGEIILSLWNEQIDQVSVGDQVKITNGWVSEFQGEKQLTTGKFGSMEIVEKSEKTDSSNSEEEPKVYTNEPDEDLSEEPINDEEYIG